MDHSRPDFFVLLTFVQFRCSLLSSFHVATLFTE